MLRIVSFVVAAAAIMAIPFSQADARSRGMSMGHGSMHMSSMRMGSGPRIGSFNSIRVNRIGSQRIFIANRRIHHGRRFFVGGYGYGLYDTCWRWVPTPYGLRRAWVCDPYGYY
jgi:hypothetical protein